MPEKDIEKLLKKYLRGTATPEEEKLVDDWYESLSGKEYMHLSDSEKGSLRNAYWAAIRSKIRLPAAKRRILWPGLIAVAASISVVLMVIFFPVPLDSGERAADAVAADGNTIIENKGDEPRSIALPDSSRVRLFANSTLEYHKDFNGVERRIHLSGQAFFEIVHNPEKPFYVLSNEVVTKVLGTSFTVTAYPGDESVTVAVATGRVSVYAPHAKSNNMQTGRDEEVILTPNQQAIYTRAEHRVSRTLVKEPRVVIAEEEIRKVRFEGAPVSEVFEVLEQMYNVNIEFDEAVFSKCAITTSVSGRDMFERIDVICEIIGASYRLEDTTIVIIGTGCN